MMTLLAKGLGWLLGAPKLMSLGIIGGMLMLGHQWWQEHQARLKAEGKRQCEVGWELAQRTAERDAARRDLAQAQQAHRQEQQSNEELRNERQKIRDEFAAHKAAASADPRCLSDSVLQLLGTAR